jgi:hypothetical protein
MIQKINAVSVGSVLLSGKSDSFIDIENCSPKELENFITGMYKNGEVSLKDTLVFRPLDLKPFAEESGLDSSNISLKYFSKVWSEPNTKRNLYRDYKSILNQMVIDGESNLNVSTMKSAVQLLDKIKNQKSFGAIYQNSIKKF